MLHFISSLHKKLKAQLQAIDSEEAELINKAKASTLALTEALTALKAVIVGYVFADEVEEINFFKETKPELVGQLLYHIKIFNIESRRPLGSRQIQENYLRHELEKLTHFSNSHLEFYQYYRMKSTYLDDRYFTRGKQDINLCDDNLMFYIDPGFSTSHDHLVAQIITNDRLEVYLNTELESLAIKAANPTWEQIGSGTCLRWTESKTSLVELIYALASSGALNNGNCEIRELTALFEQAFNVRLPDIYRTYLEIKIRSNPTKFIDTLKTAIVRKMEEEL
jgi:hypothetical protein